jgi:hypothetical protein
MPQGREIYTELLTLRPKKVQLEELYLDPNNPRFSSVQNISEERTFEDGVQKKAQENLEEIGIDDLIQKISRYGFVSTDVVVARKAKKGYVVIEGNRRLATLRNLMRANADGEITLPPQILRSMKDLSILVYEGKDPDIAWIIQGIRHMEGIKRWPPIQQAVFVAKLEKQIKKRKHKAGESHIAVVARVAGIPTATAARLLKSHYAFGQATKDEDYGDLKSDNFALFNEVVFKRESLEKWLQWNNKSRKFENNDNLKKLLSWISPSEDGGAAKITDLGDMREVLPEMISDNTLLTRFDDGALSIHEVRVELAKSKQPKEELNLDHVADQLTQTLSLVDHIPVPQVSREHQKERFLGLLKKLRESVDTQINSLGLAKDG